MKGYIFKRIAQSIFSVFIVSLLTVFLVYSCIPRQLIFKGDQTLPKLANKPDEHQDYKYRQWKLLGYIEYITQKEYAQSLYGDNSPKVAEALAPGSGFGQEFEKAISSRGFKTSRQPVSGYVYAVRDVPLMSRVLRWYARLIQIDYPGQIAGMAYIHCTGNAVSRRINCRVNASLEKSRNLVVLICGNDEMINR